MTKSIRKSRKKPASSRSLGVETLESRELMAVDGLPDYRATLVDAPETLRAGERLVQVAYEFRNDGPGDGGRAIPYRLEIVGVTNGISRELASGTLPDLPKGRRLYATPHLTIPADLPTGDYDVRLVVDPRNSHREFNETNNAIADRVRVNGTTPPPPPPPPSLMDPSFGTNGKVSFPAPGSSVGSSSSFNAAIVQADGKTVAVGFTKRGNNPDMLVMRLNRDGSPDRSFGANGAVTINFGLINLFDQANAVAVQPDGKILVVGVTSGTYGNGSFAVVRLLANGNLDTTFGSGGRVRIDFDLGGNLNDGAAAVAIQSDGRIVVGGTAAYSSTGDTDFAVARLTADGRLDSSFSADGKQTIAFDRGGARADQLSGIAIDPSGRILLAGSAEVSTGGNHDFAAARLTTNGNLDATFGDGGKVTVAFDRGGAMDDRATGIALQSDGKIVLGGYSQYNSVGTGDYDFAAVRLLSNGRLDTSFDGDGKATILFDLGGDRNDKARGIAVDSQGRIVMAGYASRSSRDFDFAAVRLKPDGSLDSSFDSDGKFTVSFNRGGSGDDAAYGMAISGNRLVLVGEAEVSDNVYDLALASLLNL